MSRRQIENRNFLNPTGFKFVLDRSPKIAFFCNQANIPDITLAVATQGTSIGRKIPHPGDELEFGDLNLRFLVDENLENYMEIQNWMRGIGYPENLQQLYDIQKKYRKEIYENTKVINLYSDGAMMVLNSSQISNFQIRFKDLFPYSLSTLSFDATQTDTEYFTADVSFKYTMYTIVDMKGNRL